MTSRALIIAVEDYPESTATSRRLPGTTEAAERFADWIVTTLGVARSDIVFCASKASDFKTHGATAAQIKLAAIDLIRAGFNDTDLLFVFLSGHGVMLPGREYDLDVLLCSDFIEPRISGSACIEVNELTEFLAKGLGIGTHLYFIDMCRSETQALDVSRLGMTPQDATSGRANWFQLSSGLPFETVSADTRFVDALLLGLNGNCKLVPDQAVEGQSWITFQNVAESVAATLVGHNRKIFVRSKGNTDYRIVPTFRHTDVATLVDGSGPRSPPVRLLVEFDDIIFLGETNGQLPKFVEQAWRERGGRRWDRLVVMSIDDLRTAFRPGASLEHLENERARCEEFFKEEGPRMADQLELYRYRYLGTYGSFWKNSTGKRRAHVSSGLATEDIRVSPASDYVDFANSRHPKVDRYFDFVEHALKAEDCRCIYRHPQREA